MNKYIDADKLIAEIESRKRFYERTYERLHQDDPEFLTSYAIASALEELRSFITSLQKEQPEVSIECGVRVYPKLDGKPRPWVSLYGKGINTISFRDLPELENLGFKDDDTAIITITRKEESK